MALFQKRSAALTGAERSETTEAKRHRLALIDNLTFEVVPMKSLDGAITALPPRAEVSVTCSPIKGIEETQRITMELLGKGFVPIPHLAARMVRDERHTQELAHWLKSNNLNKVFLVGGDAEEPGAYPDAVQFLDALLNQDHGLQTVGVTAYPDGHSFIADEALTSALFKKQELLSAAGVEGYCSTQMCFDPDIIARWLQDQRQQGLTMPVHLGIAGVVDKARLMRMGIRLGIGQSLGFLRKNRTALVKMMTSTSYDPSDLLLPLSNDMVDRGVEGLHVFTFNQVEASESWRQRELSEG